MDAQIERHQPLITARIVFAPKKFPPPPTITARMEFPSIDVSQQRERSPTPEKTSAKRFSTPKRHTTPKRASTPNERQRYQGNSVAFESSIDVDSGTTPRRASTPKRPAMPRRGATPTGTQRLQDTSVAFENDMDMGSPLTSLSDEGPESEGDEEASEKIPKPPGEAGRPQSGGYKLQDKLGWNDRIGPGAQTIARSAKNIPF